MANFQWGSLSGSQFTENVMSAYSEVAHWRSNLFHVPSGAVGKKFVSELARLIQAYADASALESVALTAVMTMPHLLLQKPGRRLKAHELAACLSRRLEAWQNGHIDELLMEARTIQQRLSFPSNRNDRHNDKLVPRNFAQLMKKGNITAADRMLSDSTGSGVLNLHQLMSSSSTRTVRDVLIEKHPQPSPSCPEAIIDPIHQAEPVHSILFQGIDGILIRNTALKSKGSAGPSGLDSSHWKRICTGFQSSSKALCNALASLARRLCTNFVDPSGAAALFACRLIPLDKKPGVRPIGVCETVRRILGKAILSVVGNDVRKAVGSLQLCAGQSSGCEAAIHAMRSIFNEPDTEAILLVDAANAFNSLNREVALKNISVLCPAIHPILVNAYRRPSSLFVGGECLLSQEGTTQGDPLAMAMYALATVPLISKISTSGSQQIWYADDAANGGKLSSIKQWWEKLVNHGPKHGYFPNGAKSWLIVKSECLDQAELLFRNTAVNITTEGRCYLGSPLGDRSFCDNYLRQKVNSWKQEIERLSFIAQSQPQAAHSAFIHGVVGRWTYLARCNDRLNEFVTPLKEVLDSKLIPALTSLPPPGDLMRNLLAFPPRLGGLGIIEPTSLQTEYTNSLKITEPLVSRLLQQDPQLGEIHEQQQCIKSSMKRLKNQAVNLAAEDLSSKLPSDLKRAMELATEKGASTWLTVLPLEVHNFALSKSEFRDALCLRYGWRPPHLPDICICGQKFTVNHAMSCPTGGFPTIRHNEVRDVIAGMMSEVCHDVDLEPTLQSLSGEVLAKKTSSRDDDARLDISACGLWGGRFQKTYFDVRVFNPNAESYRVSSVASCYKKQEMEKKRKYEERIRRVEQASFTPLVFSCTGGASKLTTTCIKKLASLLSEKNDVPYSLTICWLRCRLTFALLRSAVMCLRGSRSRRRQMCASSSLFSICAESQLYH